MEMPKLPFDIPVVPTTRRAPSSADGDKPGIGKALSKGFGCLLGGGAAALLAKNYAEKDAKRLQLSSNESKKRERGYMVGFGLLGCAGGSAVAGTAYDKLSEQGKKNRVAALSEAARSGRVQSYSDPENPADKGMITPSARVVDDSGRECVDTEDVWAQGEPAFSKVCLVPGTSNWEPAVS
jgi:F0F1-type ATP synthase membrane subunit c/vacuolar-type H+-ATPase subunit K